MNDDMMQYLQVESQSDQQSEQNMEKYCIENADPDILLHELTEVKKDLNPIP